MKISSWRAIHLNSKEENLQTYDFYIKKRVHWKISKIGKKRNNTTHRATKNTPVDVKPDTTTDIDNHNKTRKPKCKVGDLVRISSYKSIDSKSYQLN